LIEGIFPAALFLSRTKYHFLCIPAWAPFENTPRAAS
jgi:hypothetical protein